MPIFWKETFIPGQPPLLNILTQNTPYHLKLLFSTTLMLIHINTFDIVQVIQNISLENSLKMVEFSLRLVIQNPSLRQPSLHGSHDDRMAEKLPALCHSLAQLLSSWPHYSVHLWTLRWCLFQEKVLWAVQGGRCGWGSRGVRYIDKQYWLSIYRHILKISISIWPFLKISISIWPFLEISISIWPFLKISTSILTRPFLKIWISKRTRKY